MTPDLETIIPDVSIWQDRVLLENLAEAKRARDDAGREVYRLETEALRRMAERGASAIPDDAYHCELVQDTTYDQAAFTPLLEVFSEADRAICYTPEHLEPVAAKWDTNKVKALARRYGNAALVIVEAAKRTGRPRVRLELKAQ